MFVVRTASVGDLPDLYRLAAQLDTVNFPADEALLAKIVERSCASFAATLEDPSTARFLFVLEDLEQARVVGTSMVIASHGTVDDPHHYFKLDTDERYSATLDALFRHRTLQFRRSLTPHTEIGALILDPAYRGRPERLGRLLSFARFVYIGCHREAFQAKVQAELLPPFEPDGSSLLWEWLGRRFTGLDYPEADRLSNSNHEFARELFPQTPIYTSLMPPEVQAIIGAVGPSTLGVARMLERIGFQFNQHIDPFDGGPHFECATDHITLIRALRRGRLLQSESPVVDPPGLVAVADDGPGFRVICCPVIPYADSVTIAEQDARALDAPDGQLVVTAPIPGPVAP
jgi:arginine N-succinyltransferase